MFVFILNIVLMLSLGTVLFIVARALPRVQEDEGSEHVGRKNGLLERWVTSEIPERVDGFLSSFLSKVLRKLKVFLLKIDNSLSGHLKKIKSDASKTDGNGGGFRDINGNEEKE